MSTPSDGVIRAKPGAKMKGSERVAEWNHFGTVHGTTCENFEGLLSKNLRLCDKVTSSRAHDKLNGKAKLERCLRKAFYIYREIFLSENIDTFKIVNFRKLIERSHKLVPVDGP